MPLDPEKNHAIETASASHEPPQSTIQPFIGRLGGNQTFALDRNNADNAQELEKLPDAAPYMPFRAQFDLHGFLVLDLWKAAVMEGVGES